MTEPSDGSQEPVSDYRTEVQSPVIDTKATTEEQKTRVEEFVVSGRSLFGRMKEVFQESNVRRIVVKTEGGKTLLDLPLTVGVAGGVAGTIMFPLVMALGVVGFLAARLTIVVEKSI
ncbi:DUF4342 domain-containing protein [Synechococcales cyanobacterium C]|uniref:DUF4342 domain-containing protein n=1 Tax=Petrachloros mirabilis ULC683 TaxID=2781853 RepID=A0A8K2A0I3_9CYAN|nr:DUF4342 domain-containing protein [Petrachloros mirabilis]NCJ07132.1 DUF4342 domain-containing protein [Petrachloros mirabilis ULC683]